MLCNTDAFDCAFGKIFANPDMSEKDKVFMRKCKEECVHRIKLGHDPERVMMVLIQEMNQELAERQNHQVN